MTPLASFISDKKSKNRVTNFVSIQGSYNHLELALFKNNQLLDSIIKNDVKASSHLVPYLNELLANHNLTLHDLSFIAIDRGPGAFTSLRVSIATVNGIAFAHTIPLIGIDGLDALCCQTMQTSHCATQIICLLNAYNNDVYYSINKIEQEKKFSIIEKGCKKIDLLLESLDQTNSTVFTGNGALLHQTLISQKLGTQALVSPIKVCSAEIIGIMAQNRWHETTTEFPKNLTPNYIKTQEFAIKK